jgi:hypothetical protein
MEIKNGNHIYDIPGPTPSSIGEVSRYPMPASENRRKNIYPNVIENCRDLLSSLPGTRQL